MCADAPNVRVFLGVILRTFGASEDFCRILDMVEVVVTLQFLLDFITMEGQEKPKENNVVYTTKKLTIDQKRKVLEIVDKMVAERPGGKKPSQVDMSLYVTNKLGRNVSASCVRMILSKRDDILAQRAEPDSKKRKKSSKLLSREQVFFETKLEQTVVEAFTYANLTCLWLCSWRPNFTKSIQRRLWAKLLQPTKF